MSHQRYMLLKLKCKTAVGCLEAYVTISYVFTGFQK